jgi:hypothetical protein
VLRHASDALVADLARIEAEVARTLDLLAARAAAQGRGPRAEELRRSAEHARSASERILAHLAASRPPSPRRTAQPEG